MRGTYEIVSATSEGSFGSLKSSVSTTGTIITWRSARARSSSCASSPRLPSKNAIQAPVVWESDAQSEMGKAGPLVRQPELRDYFVNDAVQALLFLVHSVRPI